MSVFTSAFQVKTNGLSDVHDITQKVKEVLLTSKMTTGIAVVFVPGSTVGITTIEFEHGVVEDLKKAIERIVPQNIHYDHDARWGDGNGFAHVRAALLGPSFSAPFNNSNLLLGTWQQIILIDFDNRPRTRNIHVHIVGA